MDRSFKQKTDDTELHLKRLYDEKRQRTWGDIPPVFQMAFRSVKDTNSYGRHGFDTPLRKLLERHNWNLKKLKINKSHMGQWLITKESRRPCINLYMGFYLGRFEVQCIPVVSGREVDKYVRHHPMMDFLVWNPTETKTILMVNNIAEFIVYYFRHGDEIDMELIKAADRMINNHIEMLSYEFEVNKKEGSSIMDYFEFAKSQIETNEQSEIDLFADL